METVGDRVRRLRAASGLSQREMSCPGVSYAYISRIEAGTRQPSVKALRKLARKLGVSVEYLETGDERISVSTSLRAVERGVREWDASDAIRWFDLTAKERKEVVRGLEEALRDSLVARVHAVRLTRELASGGTR